MVGASPMRRTPSQHVEGSDPTGDSPALHVRLLGGFRVTVGDRVVPDAAWRSQKARGLVKLLCLAPSHQLHREQLLDLLWPELEPEAAAGNLRFTLHVVRRALEPTRSAGDRSPLRFQHDVLALDAAGPLSIDVDAFTAAAVEAHRRQAPETYQVALDHYPGDLLPEDRYEDWAAAPREALRETYLGLLISLAQIHESRGEYVLGITALERVVATESTYEDAHAGLMRLYALSGRPGQALRQYARMSESLERELDVKPSTTTQRLHAEIAAGHFPPPDHVSRPHVSPGELTPRHNLPIPLTSFIGRQREITGITEALNAARLLTLTGTGGCGKTRLALEVAQEVVNTYPDGGWYVELATITSTGLVPQSVASVIGIPEQPNQSLLDMLIDALRPKQLLLILDNCEHLIDVCAELAAALLGACPQLRILATSREALRVPGEVIWRVPPLSFPPELAGEPPGPSPNLEELVENEAVALFIDRVRWVRPGFALTANNAVVVAQICRRLDGLPLALELAAARASALAPEQLAERLDNALRLLSGGSRTAASRQHTLRATLDWSYALLNRPEQVLLRRLAVFAGGWTLDAVESVCAWHSEDPDDEPSIAETDVLPLLAQLVDKSLVQVEEANPGDAGVTGVRYLLLETVRQYATEQLVNSAEMNRFKNRHAGFYMTLADQSDAGLKGPQQVQWLERLSADHDNVRAALAWAFDRDAELGARLAAAMWRFWYTRDHRSEGREWLARALALADPLPLHLRAAVLRSAGALAWSQGDYENARIMAEESVALYRDLNNTEGLLQALSVLGTTLSNQGEFELAKQYHEESLALDRLGGNVWNISRALGQLAELAFSQGDYDTAQTYWEESRELDRNLADKQSVAITSNNIGEVLRARGDFERVKERFSEGLVLFQELDFKLGIAVGLANLADIHLRLGDDDPATKLLLQGITASQELKHPTITAQVLEVAVALAARQEQGRQAVQFLGAADALRASAIIPRSPAEQATIAPWTDLTRSLLSDAAWTVAWEEGQSMTSVEACEKAVETARLYSEPEEVPHFEQQSTALTQREREIAVLVAAGHTNAQIAAALGMARRTADKHVSNILHKLGYSSRADVRAWAIEQGLAPDSPASTS